MSKGSLFWANASGKLGETVLYRSGGEQRTRTYVAKIKNPKTLAQMKNRLSMLNLATIYRLLKPVLSVSFPLRKANQSGFNAFVKANKSISTAVISKDMAQNNMVVPYNMLMSEGVFNPLGSFKNGQTGLQGWDITNILTDTNAREIFADFSLGMNYVTSADQFKKMLAVLGLPASTKVTIVIATYEDDGFSMTHQTISGSSSDAEISASGLVITQDSDEVTEDDSFSSHPWFLTVGNTWDSETMVAIILSYKDGNGVLQISTSRMLLGSDNREYVEQFLEGGDVYEQVLDAYGYNVGSALE